MLTPKVNTPFPLAWGFSTLQDCDVYPTPLRSNQVHGCSIVEASNNIQQADGIWTNTKNLTIGVTVADCVPILLAGQIKNSGLPWVAAIHAGWRGATSGILRHSIKVFTDLGGTAKDLTWAFGPAILKCHFEVGNEVVIAAQQDSSWLNSFAESAPEKNKFYLDLPGLLRSQALDAGLDPTKDGSVLLCTYCNPILLNSYRRNNQCKRQWGWIKIL
jgi:hypothetical protein